MKRAAPQREDRFVTPRADEGPLIEAASPDTTDDELGYPMATPFSGLQGSRPYRGAGFRSTRKAPRARLNRADIIGSYGPSLSGAWTAAAAGEPSFLKNRLEDNFYGRGKYKKRKYKGRGMYTGSGMYTGGRGVYSLLPAAGYAAGKAIDYAVENPRATRKFFGNLGRKLFKGRGSYESNSLVDGGGSGGMTSSDVPTITTVADETGEVIIQHKEYVADVYGNELESGSATLTKPFMNHQYSLNPGLERTFPWLSQIASNYEEYEFVSLIFTFRSTVSIDVDANGQVGTVIMATNYNASRSAFDNKAVMMQYDGAVSAKVTQSCMHGIECDPNKLSGSAGKYVRANPVLVGQDLKTYDQGLFQLGIHGVPAAYANATIGELWVSYAVKLRKPKLFTSLGLGITRDVCLSGNGAPTATNIFGDTKDLLVGQQNNLGCKFESLAGANPLNTQTTYGDNIGQLKSTNGGVTFAPDLDDGGIQAPGGAIAITIPAKYSGTLEIQLMCNWQGDTSTDKFTWEKFVPYNNTYSDMSVATSGNIEVRNDMYGSNFNESTNALPSFFQSIAGEYSAMAVFHFDVKIATHGIDNRIVIGFDGPTKIPKQCYCSITEYNTFQREELGALAPQVVSSAGAVVVPS